MRWWARSCLVRREAIVEAGLLDETFFMYGEDLDWAKRITDAAGKCGTIREVTVLHIKEAASRHSYRARVEFYRALTLFYEKALPGHRRRSIWTGSISPAGSGSSAACIR